MTQGVLVIKHYLKRVGSSFQSLYNAFPSFVKILCSSSSFSLQMDTSNGEKSFLSFLSCGKVTSFFCCFFSGTPGFLHSSELKRPVRATRHPLLRSSSAQGGEEESDCVSRRSLIPPSVTVSRGSSLQTPRSCLFRLRPLPLPSRLLPYPSPPLPPA